MDHDAVFEFEVFSLEHLKPTVGSVTAEPKVAWSARNLVRGVSVGVVLGVVLDVASHS